MESTLREYKSLRKRFCWQHLPHLLFCGPLVPNFPKEQFCKQSSVFANNRWFTEFFDRYFHIPLPIVTKHELGLPFPPRNLRIKLGANPSTTFWVIVVTDRHTYTQTHTQTNASENIFPRFCGDNDKQYNQTVCSTTCIRRLSVQVELNVQYTSCSNAYNTYTVS